MDNSVYTQSKLNSSVSYLYVASLDLYILGFIIGIINTIYTVVDSMEKYCLISSHILIRLTHIFDLRTVPSYTTKIRYEL